MKVILLQDVAGVGKRHDVKELSDGYARNFLFPRSLAKQATAEALRELEAQKVRADGEEHETIKRLEEIARTLTDRSIEFTLQADKTGSAYGSVTADMITKAMRAHGWLGKERVNITLDRPIKEIGEHMVPVDLKKGIRATLKIIVRSQS